MRVRCRVNGQFVDQEVPAEATLLFLLRERLGLTGSKEGCGVGECGACTVVMDGRAVNACLTPAAKAQGKDVLTVEGLSQGGQLHPLQESFMETGAVQCGYCTPGMLMSAFALLARNPKAGREEIVEALEGNLCRCTGYDDILTAVEKVAAKGGKAS